MSGFRTSFSTRRKLGRGLGQLSLEALEPRWALDGRLAITEIMYSPLPPDPGTGFSADDMEYVELQNVGDAPLNLLNYKFTTGITFTFPDVTLQPNNYVVVAKNPLALASRYGAGIGLVVGPYGPGVLDNDGEQIRLETNAAVTVFDFEFADTWYPVTKGQGYSLTLINPATDPALYGDKLKWNASTSVNGSPGKDDSGLVADAIIINEVLAHTDEPLGDWVELKNTTGSPIDISGWFLSDDPSDLTKYKIPAGTVIPANGYVTFTQYTSFGQTPAIGTNRPFQFTEHGESVNLTSVDSSGNLGGYRRSEDFEASNREVPFARHFKSTGGSDFVPESAKTLGGPNAPPLIGPIIINEIMYSSDLANPNVVGDEWVELYNVTSAAVPLFDPLVPADVWKFGDGVVFDFPPNVTIPAGGYALVIGGASGIDAATFRTKYNVPGNVQILGPYTGLLANTGENVSIQKPGDPEHNDPNFPDGFVPFYTVDRINYSNEAPWPAAPNGTGPSLARKVASDYGNDPANWQAGPIGGTPGRANITTDTLAIDDAEVVEGNAGTVNMTFTVTLSAVVGQQVTVVYTTSSASATAGADFDTATGTVTFAAGVISQPINIAVRGDVANEINEIFFVDLSNPVGATLNDGHAEGKIRDDDLGWQNPVDYADVNKDGNVSSADALTVIDELNIRGARALTNPPVSPNEPPPFLDTNGDNAVSSSDALRVIDRLNGAPIAAPVFSAPSAAMSVKRDDEAAAVAAAISSLTVPRDGSTLGAGSTASPVEDRLVAADADDDPLQPLSSAADSALSGSEEDQSTDVADTQWSGLGSEMDDILVDLLG